MSSNKKIAAGLGFTMESEGVDMSNPESIERMLKSRAILQKENKRLKGRIKDLQKMLPSSRSQILQLRKQLNAQSKELRNDGGTKYADMKYGRNIIIIVIFAAVFSVIAGVVINDSAQQYHEDFYNSALQTVINDEKEEFINLSEEYEALKDENQQLVNQNRSLEYRNENLLRQNANRMPVRYAYYVRSSLIYNNNKTFLVTASERYEVGARGNVHDGRFTKLPYGSGNYEVTGVYEMYNP